MELQCCREFEAGSSKCKIKNLTVQKYLDFCESHNHSDLTVNQLKKVLSIHGFKTTLPRVRKEVLNDAVDWIELMDLTRSTLNDDNVSSYAFITSEEAIKDLMCLNWIECSVTSFRTFNSVNYDLISLQNANDVALKSKTMKMKEPKMSRSKDVTEPACSLASGDQCSAKGNTGDDAAAEYLSSSPLLTTKKKPLRLMRSEDIFEPTCSLASGDQCSIKGNISDSAAAEYNSSSSLLRSCVLQQASPQQLHFILVPLYCQSASTSMTEFGILLANHGVDVTIITTDDNVVCFTSLIDHANISSNLNIQLLSLDFPCKITNEVMRRQTLEKLMQELVPPPSCMVSSATQGMGYTQEIASKFKIPCYIFYPRSCFSTICALKIIDKKLLDSIDPYADSFLVPDIPHKVELKGYQSPFFRTALEVGENQSGETQNGTEKSSHIQGMLVNSFEEMEPWYLGQFKKRYSNAWGIGPVSLYQEIRDEINHGQKASIDANYYLNWLDSMKPGSVIYACFGSLSCILPSQLVEIGLGLESSNQPFIWVIRNTNYSEEIGRWLETSKFEKRVQGRGLVIRGWAPQLLILLHPSIGGFFTHCGWNSTLEGVCGGVPMITWPMFEEQHVNEKFVTDVLGIGVSIFVEARLSSKEVIVKSDRVKEAIEELMYGEKSGEMKRRARELGELANKAVEEGGSSYSNITIFIQDVLRILKEEQTNQMPCKKVKCGRKTLLLHMQYVYHQFYQAALLCKLAWLCFTKYSKFGCCIFVAWNYNVGIQYQHAGVYLCFE